jgi:NADH-quinone oxidoreductase subunit F
MNKMMPKDYPKVLFQNRKPDRITTLDEYRQSGGYSRAGGHEPALGELLTALLHRGLRLRWRAL